MLKVTLTGSLIGSHPRNRKTAYALGLRKMGQSNTFEDTPNIRGMIHNITHLVTVEEVEKQEVRRRKVVRVKKENS
jgi:large subunit ribosomal protein L30